MNAKPLPHDWTPRPDGDAREAAAYWDARLRNPECTREERAQYEAWRAADPAHADAFERQQDVLEAIRNASARPLIRAARDAALRRRKRRVFGFGLAAAAILAVAVIGVQSFTQRSPQIAVINAAPTAHVYETAIGEQRTVRLSDGSTIILNTRSRLEERFSTSRRDVTLVSGQALFEVAHDPARPFIVAAGDRQVTAIGTQFDVRLDGERVKVTLVEGRVSVERRPQGQLIDGLVSQRRELTAGQAYLSTDDALFTPVAVRSADINAAMLWREGRVAFDDAPLPEAVAEMNRYSAGALVVSDPSMSELRINGVFRTDAPEAFVNALEEYYPVEAREQPGGDTLLVWRE